MLEFVVIYVTVQHFRTSEYDLEFLFRASHGFGIWIRHVLRHCSSNYRFNSKSREVLKINPMAYINWFGLGSKKLNKCSIKHIRRTKLLHLACFKIFIMCTGYKIKQSVLL